MFSPTRSLLPTLLALACSLAPLPAAEWSLDAAWGGIGQALSPLANGSPAVSSAALQSDGKIIVAGVGATTGVGRVYVARFRTDGTLDSTWANDGILLPDQLGTTINQMAVAVQSDGKVLLATNNSNRPGNNILRVARYTAKGAPDLSFNTTGVFTKDTGSSDTAGASLAVQPDGKILVTTSFRTDGSQNFGVVRLTSDGVLDPEWGNGTGFVTTDFGVTTRDYPTAVAIQGDGKVVVAGDVISTDGTTMALTRYQANGTLDTTFGSGGKVRTLATSVLGATTATAASALLVLSNGKLLVGGKCTKPSYTTPSGTRLALVRFNSNGTVDTLFGRETAGINDRKEYGEIHALTLHNGNGIVAAGLIAPTASSSLRFGLVRCRLDGSLDTTFDAGGFFVRSPGNYGSAPRVLALADGGIALSGYASDFASSQLGVLRAHEGAETDPPVLFSPKPNSFFIPQEGIAGLSYTLPEAALLGSVALEFDDATTIRTLRFAARNETEGRHSIGFPLSDPVSARAGEIISGEPIPEGIYTVRLSYRDAASHPAGVATAERVIVDTTPPTLDLSTRIVEAQSPVGANVTFGPIATDTGDPAPVITTSRPDGSVFPLGNTIVTVTATDASGNKATGQFTVRVVDTTPPTITPPENGFTPTVIYADQGRTASLPNYSNQVLATDAVEVVRIDQTPAPGETLPEGPHEVTLTARDAVGHPASVSFVVTVRVAGTAAVAWSGLAVPGAGVDPRLPAESRWGVFGVPSITAQGHRIGWLAQVRPPSEPAFHGIFLGALDAPVLCLRTGDEVTDSAGEIVSGARFASFRDPVFAGEDFAVTATTTGTRRSSGIWCGSGLAVREVARSGQLAPGVRVRFTSFPSVAMPAPGTVFFLGALDDATTRDRGLWVWTAAGGTRFVLREGTIVPAKLPGDAEDTPTTPIFIQAFTALNAVEGSPGHGRYDAVAGSIDVLLKTSSGPAIGRVTPDGILRLAATAGSAHGAPFGWQTPSEPLARSFGMPCSRNGGLGPIAAVVALPPAGRSLMDFGFTAPILFIAAQRTSEPVAGFDANSLPIAAFILRNAKTPSSPAQSLMTAFGDVSAPYLFRREVASDQRIAPEGSGSKWKTFKSVSILDGRGPLFTATLTRTGLVTAASDTGLWVTRSNGQLDLLVRRGDSFAGRTVRNFDALGVVAGSPGQRRAWTYGDESGRVVYRVSFTDGTSAIVSTAVP